MTTQLRPTINWVRQKIGSGREALANRWNELKYKLWRTGELTPPPPPKWPMLLRTTFTDVWALSRALCFNIKDGRCALFMVVVIIEMPS
jgi:hypothetical protein